MKRLLAIASLASLIVVPSSLALSNSDYMNMGFELGSGNGNSVSSSYRESKPSALTGWSQWANSNTALGTTTEQSSTYSIDGSHSAHIIGDANNGLFQYINSPATGFHTLSAWVYVVKGSAHIALFENGGSSGNFSTASTSLNTWEFLTVTRNYTTNSAKGPVLYTAENDSEFYIDGVYLNAGQASLSPHDPSVFNPNGVPDSGTTALLLGTALLGIAAIRRKLGK